MHIFIELKGSWPVSWIRQSRWINKQNGDCGKEQYFYEGIDGQTTPYLTNFRRANKKSWQIVITLFTPSWKNLSIGRATRLLNHTDRHWAGQHQIKTQEKYLEISYVSFEQHGALPWFTWVISSGATVLVSKTSSISSRVIFSKLDLLDRPALLMSMLSPLSPTWLRTFSTKLGYSASFRTSTRWNGHVNCFHIIEAANGCTFTDFRAPKYKVQDSFIHKHARTPEIGRIPCVHFCIREDGHTLNIFKMCAKQKHVVI